MAAEAALLFEQEGAEGGIADGAGGGEGLEDAGELVLAALGLEDAEVSAELHEARGAVGDDVVTGDAGGDADGVLLGGIVAGAGVDGGVRGRGVTQMSEAGSSSNVLTMSSPVRAVERQWMRLKASPGAYSRTPAAFGVT
ncbi:hypothetical protein O0235_10595 [Tepidiforma flava]|uniref:Uncharacterized protein n=1 Tax=Tepidiforma flava TaxID=3004094 RepID=A0ABY7M3V6_9CHLR|nr:hypothetical protein [Tepidiforma flava]WBL35234.1 hypothetical protein O0235_10595 [Tepidiforma flava]